jgi:hypothetical protein
MKIIKVLLMQLSLFSHITSFLQVKKLSLDPCS